MKEEPNGRHRTTPVLIADDHPPMIRLVAAMLVHLGFAEMDDATDGAQALELMRRRRYGLVISDWHMAPMSGFALLKAVRCDPELCRTPFIMITSETRTDMVEAVRAAGASSYILKPFGLDILREKVWGLLGSAG